MNECFVNDKPWLDTDGNVVHAHGGHMLFSGGYYYLYGENRSADIYVSCYRSQNLMDWEFRSHILTTSTETAATRIRANLALTRSDGGKVNIERPKVLYNDVTGKFVMWAHYENGSDYSVAGCAVASADSPEGPFTYHGAFNPYGFMSRDCTLFKDDDGTAYFISAARDNADLHIYRLSNDYLNVSEIVARIWQGEHREAPAVVKHNGRYLMLSSYCTGWKPNQCKYAFANSMSGPWSDLVNIGDELTYRTQPAFILPLKGPNSDLLLYYGDRWGGGEPGGVYDDSRYIVLPIRFTPSGLPALPYHDRFRIDVAKAEYIPL